MIDPLPADQLRWHCDPDSLPFETTAEVEALPGVVGQDSAVAALKFGLEVDAPGQNIFVRGLTGTGRMRLVRRMLEELKPTCDIKQDRCYVHNFSEPDRPRLISLPAGRARAFRRRMHDFAEFLRDQLPEALNADSIKSRRESLDRMGNERIKKMEKSSDISEDAMHDGQQKVQKLTDTYVGKIGEILQQKEKEILEL